ncbi:hypothetical protein MKW92_050722 [Papaver armeniacum]|nr:hypothetical protein MKW92_050722 [Papaver armeniacum]
MAISRALKLGFSSLKSKYPIPPSSSSSLYRFFSDSNVSIEKEKVGFIGLGNMGFHMVNNLISSGLYHVSVHDKNFDAMKKFSERGITTKGTPFEVAQTSDMVITMLPSSSNVMEVYTGPNGLLQGGEDVVRPWLFIDSSTIDPQTSRRLSASVSNCALKEKKGYRTAPVMLDAPVSGGVLGAGWRSEDAYLSASPLFLSMGKSTIYCGGAGNGSAAKICNNLAMAVSMLGVSEALALGQSLGITASTLTKIFNSSSARCWSSDSYNPVPGVMEGVPSSKNYDGGFSSNLMAKDLKLASASAEDIGLKCPLTSQAKEIYVKLCEEGHGSKDFSCVFRHYFNGSDEC